MIPLWQYFEAELDQYNVGDTFTVGSFAADWGLDSRDVSLRVQRYLGAQRSKRAKTKYVLIRKHRTSRTIWTIGRRSVDARNDLGQFASDTKHRVLRALHPDLVRIGRINPQARSGIEQGLEPMVDGLVQVLVGVMSTVSWKD